MEKVIWTVWFSWLSCKPSPHCYRLMFNCFQVFLVIELKLSFRNNRIPKMMGWFILGKSFRLVLRSTGPVCCSKQENFREVFSRLCPIEFYICNIMEAPQLLSATYSNVWQLSLQKNCLRKKSLAAACILFALSFHSACFSTVVSLTWSKEDVFPELGCAVLLLPQYITC